MKARIRNTIAILSEAKDLWTPGAMLTAGEMHGSFASLRMTLEWGMRKSHGNTKSFLRTSVVNSPSPVK